MGRKKNIQKLFAEPKEMRIVEIENVLSHFGYHLDRTKGSHYIFAKPGCDTITVPSHKGKVSRVYIKDLKKQIINML